MTNSTCTDRKVEAPRITSIDQENFESLLKDTHHCQSL